MSPLLWPVSWLALSLVFHINAKTAAGGFEVLRKEVAYVDQLLSAHKGKLRLCSQHCACINIPLPCTVPCLTSYNAPTHHVKKLAHHGLMQ